MNDETRVEITREKWKERTAELTALPSWVKMPSPNTATLPVSSCFNFGDK